MNKQFVYIAGYGRSGSTLLERILCTNDRFLGLGEASNLLHVINDDKLTCNCGNRLTDCDIWGRLVSIYQSEKDQIQLHAIKKMESLWRLSYFSPGKTNLIKSYFGKLLETGYPRTKYIVDSSKTTTTTFYRPYMINKCGFPLKVIHIVRDPRACLYSNIRGSNKKMEQGLRGGESRKRFVFLRTLIIWNVSNMGALLLKHKVGKQNYLQIDYDALVTKSEETLKEISAFFGEDLTDALSRLKSEENMRNNHQFSGNRMRREKKIVIKQDEKWKEEIKGLRSLIYSICSYPVKRWIKEG